MKRVPQIVKVVGYDHLSDNLSARGKQQLSEAIAGRVVFQCSSVTDGDDKGFYRCHRCVRTTCESGSNSIDNGKLIIENEGIGFLINYQFSILN